MSKSENTAVRATGTFRPGFARRRTALMLSAGVLALVSARPAFAQVAPTELPTAGSVTRGAASIDSSGAAMTINQSTDRAVIDWGTFNIGSSASVAFTQPSATSIALNRVTSGALPSEINGSLSSNGIVAILNPNGVLFGGTANVDVGGLIATSGSMDTDAFMAGGNTLGVTGAVTGEIVVSAGASITIAEAGLAAFVGPRVRNEGVITARLGKVALGAGETFTLDLAGDGLLEIGVGSASPLAQNSGSILAEGGLVRISAKAASALVSDIVNTSGVVSVGSVSVDGGTVVLEAVNGGASIGGTLEAAGTNGSVAVTATGDVTVASALTTGGAASISGRRIRGAAVVGNSSGALTLNVAPGGADTTAEGSFIADALGVIGTVSGGTTVNLGAGTYRAGATIGTNGVVVDGGNVATISAKANGEDGLTVNADNVTVRGLTIVGPADQAYSTFNWGSTITRGIALRNGADNVTVSGNTIQGVRNGILVDGRNASASITNNVIDNTKSGISVQYTDGSAMTIAGNSEGAFGNEWGLNVHLNGVLQGNGSITPSGGALGANTPLVEQQRLLALSAANGGFSVFNQAWSASNRTRVNVATTGVPSAQGSLLSPISTVQGGVDAVVSGGLVTVQAGTYVGNVRIAKAGLTLVSVGGRDATTIQGVSGLGALGAVVIAPNANNVTLGGTGTGFTILGIDNGAPGIENAAVYFQGANSGTTVRGNRITANGDDGLLTEYSAAISNLTIDSNIFDGQTFVGATPGGSGFGQQFAVANVPRQLVVIGGGNGGGNTSNVTFTNNAITGTGGGLTAGAAEQGNTLVTIDSQGATITGNTFAGTSNRYASQLRARGTNTMISGNMFDNRNFTASTSPIYVRDSIFGGAGQSDFATLIGANSFVGKGAWADVTTSGFHSFMMSVNGAIAEAGSGAVISVRPGDYVEGVTGVDLFGGAGGQKFGLYAYKSNITLRGVDASGNAITDANNVSAFITAANQAGFGAQHWVSGSNVVVEGLGFRPAAAGDNKLLEVIGDNFTLRNSVLDNRGNITAADIYINAQESAGGPAVERFNISNNIMYGGTSPYTLAVVAAGAGLTTDATNRVFDGNTLIGSGVAGQRGFQIQGRIPSTAWQQLQAGAVTVTNNSFTDIDIPVRTVGTLVQSLAWNDVLFNNGNVFNNGAVLAFVGGTDTARGVTTVDGAESYDDIRITTGIQASIDRAQGGDTVKMLNGTYNLGSSRLIVGKSITLAGQSQAGVIIDGRGVGAGLGTMLVSADNVTLSGFTLYGADSGANNYGIKVQPNPTGYNANQRLLNFAISDVTVRGSTRAELDLNGVVGATITNFTADGRRVSNDAFESGGAGVQITDSQNVTLTGVTTLGNAWGSVAIYQSNKPGAYNGLTSGININAGNSSFAESIGVFVQVESTLHPQIGQLNLTGFDYAVRNTGHRAEGSQFTFFRTNLTDAMGFALALGASDTSSVEGWNGSAFTNVFTVDSGLTIGAAVRDARAGGTVNVGAGTYAEALAIDKGIRLAGAGMDATTLTNGIKLNGSMTGLTLTGFTVRGASGSSVINGGQVTGLTVDGVRIDGEGVAGRHGFIGGQYGGDISITNSEFLNIRGWAAFDTRSGAGGANDGTQITSAVFSNNLLDNTAGHIAFRQQTGAFAYPDVTFADNIVRNVGDSTLSFGAIFKAFRAGTVNVTGNNISDIGISSWTPTGEATYGAALMVRSAAVLNVTGNTFTNNNQVFAVEPGLALPGSTVFSGNRFDNNRYSIYLPTNVSGAGTIQFGAGNDFVAGADTLQHIVWRSPSTLDLTNVAFDAVLTRDMGLTQLFTVADLISDGIDVSGSGLASLVDGQLFVTTGSGSNAALRAAAFAASGDTINLSAGTHGITNTLSIGDGISLVGQGSSATTIDASGNTAYGIRVKGNNALLTGFALSGPTAATNAAYGIKVEAGSGGASGRNTGFTIRDVAVDGSFRTGLDLNAAVNAMIDGVTVTNVINGNGIAITDSDGVTVRNSTTSGNAWGGLALYQANNLGGGGSNQQLTNLTVEANNNFGEANGVYLQASSTLMGPGALNIAGYSFTVRNAAFRGEGNEFTFFRSSLQDALDYSVNLGGGSAGASLVRGWTGTADDANLYVGFGALNGGGTQALSIQTAFDLSGTGDTIRVASGSYGETATLATLRALSFGDVTLDTLTLASGAAGSSLTGSLTATTGLSFAGDIVLAGTTTLAGPSVVLAGVTGAQALTLTGGTVSLGASSLASLTASGTTITTAGVTTTGAQSYTGATTLNGVYTGGSFGVTGATTLGGTTSVSTGGAASFGTIGGANALTVNAGTGAVTLGGVTGLTSLSATGATIGTAGATTSGAQSYTGATTLNGVYAGGSFGVTGATTLGGTTSVSTGGGAAGFGTIGGANALTVNAGTGAVTMGGVTGLTSLTATGATIGTAGATTTGAQSYTGATTLTGVYSGGSFGVTGATTLGGTTNVSTGGGAASFGTIGGANALTVNAGTGAVTLGGVTGLTSLTATGATIGTAGATTTGAQSYTGATTLNGVYTGGSFGVTGATTLGGTASVSTGGGAASFGAIGGANALTVNAGTGAVTLGGVTGLTSLTATGATIGTAGATTTGAQSYTGATTLNGVYSGGGLSVAGATVLGGATTVNVGSGAASFGSVNGGQSFTVSGTGTASFGAVGQTVQLGAMSVTANQTVLNGNLYRAASIALNGAGTGATVRLTQGTTTFNTVVPIGPAGAIVIVPSLIGTSAGSQNVVFTAGTGTAETNDGDITIGNAGSDTVRLGALTATGNDFLGQTVKLAGNFSGNLSGNQTFSAQTLDTLGNVSSVVAGNETGPIVAGGSVTIQAGGQGTGSVQSGGPVTMSYGSSVTRAITSTGPVSVASTGGSVNGSVTSGGAVNVTTNNGSVGTTINASGPVTVGSTGGAINGAITSTGPVSVTTNSGAVSSAINSGGAVTVKSTTGSVGGSITSTGPVTISSTSGSVGSTIQSGGGVSVTSTSGTVGGSIGASGPVSITSGGTVSSTVSTPGAVAITSTVPVTVQVNGGTLQLNAPGGTVKGTFGTISTSAGGTFLVNNEPVIGDGGVNARQIITDKFVLPAGGAVAANGTVSLPAGLAIALIAPAGEGQGGTRPAVLVNSVERIGELLRLGYTAIIIQIDESDDEAEQELAASAN